MTSPNHILGGIAFTGLFGSFTGLNILSDPYLLATTITGAIWPDIDHPKSIIGKAFYPIALWINRQYGHRTITHSLCMLIAFSLLLYGLCRLFQWPFTIVQAFAISYTSHLILDMMTVQGVPLFYPFLRNPCVIPGNPELRFTTGNIRSETILFCAFACSLVFLQPLMQTGFWTQYNRLFGTPKHLASQIKKSTTTVLATYKYKRGSQVFESCGYAIEVNNKEVVFLEDGRWLKIPIEDIIQVVPEPTDQQLLLQQQEFRFLSTDSLNHLLEGKRLQQIEVFSEAPFIVQNGLAKNNSRHFSTQYSQPIFYTPTAHSPSVNAQFKIIPNPQILSLDLKIKKLQKIHQDKWKAYQKNQDEKRELLQQIEKTKSDLYQKEIALNKLKKFKDLLPPHSIDEEVHAIHAQIKLLKEKDALRIQQKKEAHLQRLQQAQSPPPLLSGHFTYIQIF